MFWALLAICGSLWAVMTASLIYCGETRHSILLARRVEHERKLNSDGGNIDVPENMKQRSAKDLFAVTLSRPFRFLGTELIIVCAAVYNGYLYGLSFLFNTAFALVFGQGHGFDTIGVGVCFLGLVIGISLGPVVNIWQEKHYQKRVEESGGKNVPEARVGILPKIAAICESTILGFRSCVFYVSLRADSTTTVFPISLLLFALTTGPGIHPILPILASTLWGFSFYTLILMYVPALHKPVIFMRYCSC